MAQINGQEIGPIGYGLMGFTWRPTPTPHEQAFKAMKAALANGMNFWNGGEFYGTPDNNSLTLLERYFTQYPEDADKVVLSIKGAFNSSKFKIDGSPEEIRRCIDNCLKLLKGRKKIDFFECARRDPSVPQEVTFAAIQDYIDKGLVGAISLSEVSASTIHEAVKLTKVAFVEVELSLFCTDILTNGVAAACAQYSIPIIAYSPLGRGVSFPALSLLVTPGSQAPADPNRQLQNNRRAPRASQDVPTLPARCVPHQPRADKAG